MRELAAFVVVAAVVVTACSSQTSGAPLTPHPWHQLSGAELQSCVEASSGGNACAGTPPCSGECGPRFRDYDLDTKDCRACRDREFYSRGYAPLYPLKTEAQLAQENHARNSK